jgi:hypothetical protein
LKESQTLNTRQTVWHKDDIYSVGNLLIRRMKRLQMHSVRATDAAGSTGEDQFTGLSTHQHQGGNKSSLATPKSMNILLFG